MRTLDLTKLDTSDATLIEASAGTGKTWTITALFVLLVLEKQLRPEEILVVTYTRAATAELRDRLRRRLSDTLDLFRSGRTARDDFESLLLARTKNVDGACRLLTRALYTFDDAAVYTIHGFCQRALLENAFESGSLFDTEMSADQTELIRQVCDDYWRSKILMEEEPFLEWLVGGAWSPDKLAAPFYGHYQNPFLKVIPDADQRDVISLIRQRDHLLPDVAGMWQSERLAVLDQIERANLNRTSYKPERVEAAARQLDADFGAGRLVNGCSCLELFTPPRLRRAMKKDSVEPEHRFFDLCHRLHQAAEQVEAAFREKLVHHQLALRQYVREELARRKQSLNLRSYDDLLLDLHLALEGHGGERLKAGLQQRYRAALIDEFQDTDPLQWRIFARIAGIFSSAPNRDAESSFGQDQAAGTGGAKYPLFLIGDPKQAIYSFRGADIHAYLAAARSIEPHRRWTLDTSRRSSQRLIRAINTLFDQEDPFLCREIAFTRVESGRLPDQQLRRRGEPLRQPLRFWVLPRPEPGKAANKAAARTAATAATVAEIACLLAGDVEITTKDGQRRPLHPRDIAILVKTHAQADLIQQALQEQRIPSVQHGSATIFESCEALDLLRILRAAAEPYRAGLVREALLSGVIGLSADQVFALGMNEDKWEWWLARFRELHDSAREGGVIALAAHLLGECGVKREILARAGGERRMTNVLHCLDLLHQAERKQDLSLEAMILWLERRITGQEQDDAYLLRLETDADAVIISTIHASKGLEYPVVFLPFAWDPPASRNNRVLFHDNQGDLVLDLGSELRDSQHKQWSKEEQDAEAARLLYVALTRAEFLCYVAWGCISGAHAAPLARLLHGRKYPDSKTFAGAKDEEILKDIDRLGGESADQDGPAIWAELMPLEQVPAAYHPQEQIVQTPVCRALNRTIPIDWRVSSFSAIAGGQRQLQPHDHDAMPDRVDVAEEATDASQKSERLTIFDFPRGSAAGSCLHEIFETLDFSRAAGYEESVQQALQRHGYDRQWLSAVSGMTKTVATAAVLSERPEFALNALRAGAWQTELEFFLPLKKLSGELLRDTFAGLLDPQTHGDYAETLAALQITETRGMLQGFIDMVFEYEGRFYIIDWKSNHLGGATTSYGQEQLRQAMADHGYVLQYHLYALALDRLLRMRINDYDYGTHFGGAIYIFLRGVTHDGHYGVFRDKPSAEFIVRANRLLLAEPFYSK